jgi:hypothetical protein
MGPRARPCFAWAVALEEKQAADWRDGAAYAPLLEADRSILAWEWLRRDPAYRAAWMAAQACGASGKAERPDRWRLQVFEPPCLAAPDARPIWCAHRHPPVLSAIAGRAARKEDRFELARLDSLARLVRSESGREHLLISDGLRAVRLDVLAGTLTEGPVELRYLLSGLASAERPLLTLRRLLALARDGRFARSLHPPKPRAGRWVLLLRAWDALEAGAGQRAIAETLLSRTAFEPRWRSAAPSLRSRAQRLVRGARLMAGGNYVGLLE